MTDDYSGEFMANVTIPKEFRHIISGPVRFQKHVIVGAGTVVLPSVIVGEGAAIGALSLVHMKVEPWTINLGVPLRVVNSRRKELLALEERLMKMPNDSSPGSP